MRGDFHIIIPTFSMCMCVGVCLCGRVNEIAAAV